MRALVIITIILFALLYYVNGQFLPSKLRAAKDVVDRHISSLLIGDNNETTYKAHVKLYPRIVNLENLHIKAGYGKLDHIEFSNLTLDVDRIEYNPDAAIWNGRREIASIGKIDFRGFLSMDEIAKQLDTQNEDLVDIVLRNEDGHIYLRSYFSPFKDKLEFDGDFVLTPVGDIRYIIRKIMDTDGREQDSPKVRQMIDETVNLSFPLSVMERRISFNELEVLKTGLYLSGIYNGDTVEIQKPVKNDEENKTETP
jgi:hypothetical protein